MSAEEVVKAEYQRWCKLRDKDLISLPGPIFRFKVSQLLHQWNIFCISKSSPWDFTWAAAPKEAPAEPVGCSWCLPSWATSQSAQAGFATWAEHHSNFLESFVWGWASYKPSAEIPPVRILIQAAAHLPPKKCCFEEEETVWEDREVSVL